jgi:VanZ family protein
VLVYAILLAAMLRRTRAGRLAVVFLWMVLLTFWSSLSTLPFDRPPVEHLLFGLQHRAAHIVAFGTLALLARWAFDGLPRPALLAIILASSFGAVDELHQVFTPRRHPGLDDWLVDTLAACLAVLIWVRLVRGRRFARQLAPVAVACLFVVGSLLGASAVSSGARLPGQIRRVTAGVVPPQATQAARDLARSTLSLVPRL